MRVSIVVPTFNEEGTIAECLLAVLNQTVPASEIIVVDNASTDRTVAVVARLQQEYPEGKITLFCQDKQGLIPTRNLGLDRASGDILGRIDADSRLKPEWVEQVQRSFIDPAVAAATGPVFYYDMPWRRFGLEADDAVRRLMLKMVPPECRFLFGSNMAVRRSVWERIRSETCDDEGDQMHEDIDLALHLARHTLHIEYVPAMVSGISARRLEDSPRDFLYYVTRFERTYRAHNMRTTLLKTPMMIFLSIYFPLKAVRAVYLGESSLSTAIRSRLAAIGQ